MHSHVFTIARFTLLEAYRTRLPLLAAGVLASVWAGSLFIHQISITESDRLQWSFYASGARLSSVFMLALYITSSVVREFNEKGLELVLSLDLPRSSYVLGKVSGFVAVCAVLALLAALPMLASVPVAVVGVWCASLFLELAIVCALSVFCIVTFSQVLPAVTLIFGLYLLGRTITAMRLMSETALIGKMGGARPALDFGVDLLSYIIPPLDRFAMTEWIAEKAVAPDVLGPIVLLAAISVALLIAAALFDFYRREI